MISGHIGTGRYVLFQRDPRTPSAPSLEVGRLVVVEVDGDTRVEHWFLFTNAPAGSGYSAYVRPSATFAGTPVGLSFRGAGAESEEFDVSDFQARLALSTGCGIEYIEARCDRVASNDARLSPVSAAMPNAPQQVDLGIYDISQNDRRVGVLLVSRTSSGTLESWQLFDGVPTTTLNEGPYLAPDATVGGSYALTYVGSMETPDLTGRAVVTVNALCAVAA